jgi:hypothetical protein
VEAPPGRCGRQPRRSHWKITGYATNAVEFRKKLRFFRTLLEFIMTRDVNWPCAWFTCDARASGNFCHEINFQIVRGDSYRFRDSGRDSGSNAAVLNVMEALRTNFPRLNFSTPNVND